MDLPGKSKFRMFRDPGSCGFFPSCLKYQRPIPGKSTAPTSSEGTVQEAWTATSATCGMLRSHGWRLRYDIELVRNDDDDDDDHDDHDDDDDDHDHDDDDHDDDDDDEFHTRKGLILPF